MANVILVIDDDPDQRKLMERTLSTAGHRIMTASDGHVGLEMAVAMGPKLIILDVVMPRLNGYQTARALRENPATAETPILMITSKQEPADEFWASQVGATAFLTKPVDIAGLIAAVNRLTAKA
jgi:twitching motility two-component system response regulator PilH